MKPATLHKLLGEVSQRQIDTQGKGVPFIGIPTGFAALDDVSGGMRPDTVTIVAGRTGMGKTSFTLSLVYAAASMGYNITYISLEMSESMLFLRLLSMLTGVQPNDIERGRMNDGQLQSVKTAGQHILTLPINIIERGMSSDMITDTVGNGYPNTQLLVIDHIGILRDNQSASQYEKMTQVSHNVRATARDLNIPILALTQLNRQADNREDHIPVAADIRDAGAIEEDAEQIWFPFRPQYYLTNDPNTAPIPYGEAERNAKLFIAKNRQGPLGAISLWFYPHSTVWTDKTPPPRLPKSGQANHVPPRQFVSGNLASIAKKV